MSSSSSKDAQHYKLIPEIKKNEIGWTAKVIVAEKGIPRSTNQSPTKHQALRLIDPKGNSVRATIYANNISAFEGKLEVTKTYLISNASVREAKPEYRKTDDEMYWIINAKTIVQELDEKNNEMLESTYNFSTLDNIQAHMDNQTELNILVAVIDIRPKRPVLTSYGPTNIQELVVIDQRFKTVTLTMWDNFAENESNAISAIIHKKPIIAGLHLKVVSFNGINIQTKPSSSFIIEPQFESARLLRTWVIENSSKLNAMINNREYLSSTIPLQPPTSNQIVQIKDINDMLLMRTTFWVKAKINITNYSQPFWYMACEKCCKTTGSKYGDFFECMFCKTMQAKAVPRPKIDVTLSDSTGSLQAVVFGEVAETMFACNANDLMTLHSKASDQASLDSFFKLSNDKELIVYIRSTKKESTSIQPQRFSIACFFNESDKPPTESTQTNVDIDHGNIDERQKKQKLDHAPASQGNI